MRNPFQHIPGCYVRENEMLARHTSFRIGGPARYFIIVRSLRALKKVFEKSRDIDCRVYVLGAGTNTLCSDKGFDGVVVKLKGYFLRIRSYDNHFFCGAGVLLEKLLSEACSRGYGGGEFLAGIPGTLGGAIYCNAGAFGRSIGDLTEQIKVLTPKGVIKKLHREHLEFVYRDSGLPGHTIVLGAVLRFKKGNVRLIRKRLRDKHNYRSVHQPAGYSAGSYFKNPRPFAAGKLIDDCGLKGKRVGQALVSKKHANWIINDGGATAAEILQLASMIKRTVRRKTGVVLHEEVRKLK